MLHIIKMFFILTLVLELYILTIHRLLLLLELDGEFLFPSARLNISFFLKGSKSENKIMRRLCKWHN